jgi:exopolyphosphatase/guanosine-5'-triphosphate,3'-diphosphate pyrophosphatase
MIHDPPRYEDLNQMEEEIVQKITDAIKTFENFLSKDTVFIGTAGTVTSLAAISLGLASFEHNKIQNHKLTIGNVKSIYVKISTMSCAARSRIIPFDLARLDIIVPGTLILLKLMEAFGFDEITVSNFGLREGILIDLFKNVS